MSVTTVQQTNLCIETGEDVDEKSINTLNEDFATMDIPLKVFKEGNSDYWQLTFIKAEED